MSGCYYEHWRVITLQVLVPLNLNELAGQKLVNWKNVSDEFDEGDFIAS